MDRSIELEMIKKEALSIRDICYLTVSGSIAYGTDVETSDIDIRGIYMNSIDQLLGTSKRPDVIDKKNPDMAIYSFLKIVSLLSNCNPNVIELLGTREKDQLYINKVGKALLDNKEMFLSKKAYYSFGGYAISQLRRLENGLYAQDEEDVPEDKRAEQLTNSLEYIGQSINDRFPDEKVSIIHFFKGDDNDVTMDIMARKIKVRAFINLAKEIESTCNNFDKVNHRNRKKTDDKLFKHAMHLMRLYYMAIDILKNREINTYREKEHDYLMSIRNGEVSMESIFKTQKKLEEKLYDAYENSKLPDEVDSDKIKWFINYQFYEYHGIVINNVAQYGF